MFRTHLSHVHFQTHSKQWLRLDKLFTSSHSNMSVFSIYYVHPYLLLIKCGGKVSTCDTRPHINSSSGWSCTSLYWRHMYYTVTCSTLFPHILMIIVLMRVNHFIYTMYNIYTAHCWLLTVDWDCLTDLLLTVGYHGNEINKPLHSNGHLSIVAHVGSSHKSISVVVRILWKKGIGPSQGRYLQTGQHKHRINTDIHDSNGIRASEVSSCLTLGDLHPYLLILNIFCEHKN
jgi:hypothetical protein